MPTLIEILTKFIKLILNREEMYSLEGTISAVNETDLTCTFTPDNGDTEIEDVKLSNNASSKLKIIPKNSTKGIMTFFTPESGYISYVNEPKKYLIETDGGKFEITDTEILFNGGSNDGLINIIDLITKLNNIENDINSLKTAFSGWTVVPNDGGLALKTATTTWYGSSLTPTVKGDIEDATIKH